MTTLFLPWDQEHLGNLEDQQIQWDPEIQEEISVKSLWKQGQSSTKGIQSKFPT